MMVKQNNFTLLEYKSIYYKKDDIYDKDENHNLVVPKKVFDELKLFVLKNSHTAQFLKPSHKNGLGECLTAQNFVGLIQTKDGTTIDILPKIYNVDEDESKAKEILVKMLKSLKNSPFKNIDFANLKSCKMPLLEIFITMFLGELAILVQKGIKSEYLQKEENLKFLKGKLNIKEQLSKNLIHKERFYTSYDEFSTNIAQNRVIKLTLQFLYKKSKLNSNLQRIREFLFVFDDIKASKNIKQDFSNINFNRTMKSYEQTILWCKTFLQEFSFSPYRGDETAFALLFDMNKLFESYVGSFLKRRFKRVNISLQNKGKYLVKEPRKFALIPDIVVNDGEKIADTKWKRINNEKDISQSDMYQLYAYGKKYEDCKRLYLIYPYCGQNELKLKYVLEDGLNLRVWFFDLEKSLDWK